MIGEEKMNELKQLFKELLVIVQQYGDSSYNTQKEIIKRIISDMDSAGTDIEKISRVKREYKKLFFQKVHYLSFMFGRRILLKEKNK